MNLSPKISLSYEREFSNTGSLSFGCLLDVNLHHFSVTVPTSYRLKFTIIRSIYFWLSLDFWIWSSFGCLLDVNLHHFSVTVPTSYRLKFTNIRSRIFLAQLSLSLELCLNLSWSSFIYIACIGIHFQV